MVSPAIPRARPEFQPPRYLLLKHRVADHQMSVCDGGMSEVSLGGLGCVCWTAELYLRMRVRGRARHSQSVTPPVPAPPSPPLFLVQQKR